MIITDVDVQVVNLPLTNPFTSSFETKVGETRTIIRIRTDEGIEGWGETMWGAPVAHLVRQLADSLIGTSPFALEAFHRRHTMVPFFYGYIGHAALAGLDVACWDVIGKVTGPGRRCPRPSRGARRPRGARRRRSGLHGRQAQGHEGRRR
jgi:glucarate dehydratase